MTGTLLKFTNLGSSVKALPIPSLTELRAPQYCPLSPSAQEHQLALKALTPEDRMPRRCLVAPFELERAWGGIEAALLQTEPRFGGGERQRSGLAKGKLTPNQLSKSHDAYSWILPARK